MTADVAAHPPDKVERRPLDKGGDPHDVPVGGGNHRIKPAADIKADHDNGIRHVDADGCRVCSAANLAERRGWVFGPDQTLIRTAMDADHERGIRHGVDAGCWRCDERRSPLGVVRDDPPPPVRDAEDARLARIGHSYGWHKGDRFDRTCPACAAGEVPTTTSVPPPRDNRRPVWDERRPVLRQFAREHRAQPGRFGRDFTGYDKHLQRDCPMCLLDAGFDSEVRPGEAVMFRQELMKP